jgi:hypothetical protein
MFAPKAWMVRSIAVAAIATTCFAAGLPSTPAWGDGFHRGGFGGFHGGFRGGFGGFHGGFGCFNCRGFGFRGGFFGFGPGWGIPYGYPYAYGYPYSYPYPFLYGYPYGGYSSAPVPGTYAPGPQAAAPAGQSCYAGAYVCPMERPVPSGSACYCLSNNRSHVPGRAS